MPEEERTDTQLSDEEVAAVSADVALQQLRRNPIIAPELAIIRSATVALHLTSQRLHNVLEALKEGNTAVPDGALQSLVQEEQNRLLEAIPKMGLEEVFDVYRIGSQAFSSALGEARDRYFKRLAEQMKAGIPCPAVPGGLKSPSVTLFHGTLEACAAVALYIAEWSKREEIPYTLFRNAEDGPDCGQVRTFPAAWWHSAAKTEDRFKEVFSDEHVDGAFIMIADAEMLAPAGDKRQRVMLKTLARAADRLTMPIVACYVGQDRVSPRKGVRIVPVEHRTDLETGEQKLFVDGERVDDGVDKRCTR